MKVGLRECGGEPVTCMVIVLKDIQVLTKIMGGEPHSIFKYIGPDNKMKNNIFLLVVKGEIQEASVIELNSHFFQLGNQYIE